MSDVEKCTHLTTRSVVYHAVWSGELGKLRNGVLTHSQAWAIVLVALLLPCLGGGGNMLIMFSMVKLLTSGTWRGDAIACVGATLLKWPMQQVISEESPIWKQFGGDESHALLIVFLLETAAILSWAHVPISSGRLWQFDHATKFAVLLGIFILLHNPVSSAFWKPIALSYLGFKVKK
jgi:hypothetical protein